MSLIEKLSRWNRRRLDLRKLARIKKQQAPYERWLQEAAILSPTDYDRLKNKLEQPELLISVIIQVKDSANCEHLKAAIAAMKSQAYTHFEALICFEKDQVSHAHDIAAQVARGDRRFINLDLSTLHPKALTTNSALAIATGDFVTFVDHRDLLSNYALAAIVQALRETPEARMVYSDHDHVDDSGKRSAPHFKTKWNPHLLRAKNYLGNSITIRRSLLPALGKVNVEFKEAQNLDLALRCSELYGDDQIVHIPLILHHQRFSNDKTESQTETSEATHENTLFVIREHLKRTKADAAAEAQSDSIRIRYKQPSNQPLVSVIILTKDKPNLLKRCVASIIEKTEYKNIDFIIVDNGTRDSEALNILSNLSKKDNIKIIRDDSPFNYSALNNRAASIANGEYLCLLNNDIEVFDGQWLNELMAVATQNDVGAVGARLFYPGGRLQHAGVILGHHGVAGHPFRMQVRDDTHYMSRPHLLQEMSAVTAACMVTPRALYQYLGGMEEEHLSVAYNDVDYCLKIRAENLKILYVPHAELIHHESLSRGFDNTTEKKKRIQREAIYMRNRWANCIDDDPFYNQNLSLDNDLFSISSPPRLKASAWLNL